jgi:cyclic pyranopterin phosphate synthase
MSVLDRHNRPLGNLRLSVTDRCNLRCGYCMPEEEYNWLAKPELLTLPEFKVLVDAFCLLGVRKVRLTGGEPLLRRDLPELISMLRANEQLEDIAMTTNGVLLEGMAKSLQQAGIGRMTVSLDSLDEERYFGLSQRRGLPQVVAGLEALRDLGFEKTKIDTVVLSGINDGELIDLIEFGREMQAQVRFIEYMDVGGATRWSMDKVVSKEQILERVESHYGPVQKMGERNSAPADRYRLPDGTIFGVISSTTDPFCSACDRSRITADGTWYTCLYARTGRDLRTPLRQGMDAQALAELISSGWSTRSDRGAEERVELAQRDALFGAKELKADPRLEMHTRGG